MIMAEDLLERIKVLEARVAELTPSEPPNAGMAIVNEVCSEQHVHPVDVLSNSCKRHLAHARQDIMLRMQEELGWSLNTIGRFFRRDHTTVMAGIKQARKRA